MIFVIVGSVYQQDWTWSDAGHHIDRARMVIVYPIEYLSCYQSSWCEHGGEMALRRDVTLESRKDFSIGTIGDDRFDRWLISCCQNECRSSQRDRPTCNGMWSPEFRIGKWAS